MLPRVSDMRAPAPLHNELTAELRLRGFEGDLAPAYGDRIVSATDNSIYQLLPQLVVFPRSVDDLVRIARVAAEPRFKDIVFAPRGGGTGTNGQSLTEGLVVDVSRHMNRILEINPDERWVRVAGRRGEGSAQRRAGRTRPVLPAGTLHLQSRHDRRHDQHRRQRPGLLPLRQDARPCAGADDRIAGRHGLDIASAGGAGAAASSAANRPRRRRSPAGRCDPARAGGPDRSAFPEAQPLPDRLRPRSHPRRSRPLQPELDPLRRRGHACSDCGSQAERGADPQTQRAGQRALRQLRCRLARCPGVDPVRCGLDRDRRFQGARPGAGRRGLGLRPAILPRRRRPARHGREPRRVRRRYRGGGRGPGPADDGGARIEPTHRAAGAALPWRVARPR